MISANRLLTYGEIEAAWGSAVAAIPKTSFDPKDVPEALMALIPYAIIWGESDDSIREEIARHTPQGLKANLKWIVSKYDDQLDDWLAGPEASSPTPTDAYIAFSAMRMASDFL